MIPSTLAEFDRYSVAEWRFETERYAILFWAAEEYLDPARSGNLHDWFCAVVAVYSTEGDGELLGWDTLGGCSYGSLREFHAAHRWQYSRHQRKWITDPKSRAWKALEARRPRRTDGTRADGHDFPSMVREAVREARVKVATRSEGARRA